ncbi:hypothetical protein AX14_001467 [Amanita brunnescens Koide BX004]|nr:hypothetical protein AX14_001467 [Amanita brunnescens Koide BX004]
MSESQKRFLLYAAPTPNGYPISAFLEELKAIYPGIDYDVDLINIWETRHKEPWYLKLNPNGRIPVLVDRSRNDFTVFETSAILLYLAQHYDKDFKFGFHPINDADEYSVALQWLFFSHGGLGPMQGQAHHFLHYAPEDIPYGKKRYGDEVKRLYGVFEIRLKDREYLAGPGKGHYTIADVKAWPWVNIHNRAGIPSLDEWPNVKAWLQRSVEREGSKRGREILNPPK